MHTITINPTNAPEFGAPNARQEMFIRLLRAKTLRHLAGKRMRKCYETYQLKEMDQMRDFLAKTGAQMEQYKNEINDLAASGGYTIEDFEVSNEQIKAWGIDILEGIPDYLL